MTDIDPDRVVAREAHLAVNRLATVGELAAAVAHELGTPLAVVQARAQMIAAGEVEPGDLRKEAEAIVQQTRRMTRMVREVLELAQPKAALKVAIDLDALARQTASLLEPLARQRQTRITVTGEASTTSTLGDSSQLLQVLTNLTMNAIQAMPRGGIVRLEVTTRVARGPDDAEARDYQCIDVRDEGDGVPEALRTRIFEPFFTTKARAAGTGLGLSVSSRLTRDHGGWIGHENGPEKGCCFTVYLPPLDSATHLRVQSDGLLGQDLTA